MRITSLSSSESPSCMNNSSSSPSSSEHSVLRLAESYEQLVDSFLEARRLPWTRRVKALTRRVFPLQSPTPDSLRFIFWDDPSREGLHQSAEDSPWSDVLPPQNDMIDQSYVSVEVKHKDRNQKADLTLKGVVDTIIKDDFPRLTQSQRLLFEASPFGIFLGIHILHGDLLLLHLMMLHKIRSQQLFEMGSWSYVDLLHDERGRSDSNIRARLFPDISYAHLQLNDLEDFITSPSYSAVQDEDVVMLIQLVFMFAWCTYFWTYTSRLMHGMFKKIEEFRLLKQTNPESKKVHKYTISGFMLPFKIWILETFPEATPFYICTPTELPHMRVWRSKTPFSWLQFRRIINMSVPKNQPIKVVANPTKMMLPFYVRYINWTLYHQESPRRQRSPKKDEPDRKLEPDTGFREEEEEEEMINVLEKELCKFLKLKNCILGFCQGQLADSMIELDDLDELFLELDESLMGLDELMHLMAKSSSFCLVLG
uniref:Uncharacterized protein n=1 Tax=Lactuca sativa TaxID=4236 RepID=A0A9R1XLP0_LACSA|nr:hypothetical protein LSAT_V11C300137010 [Lactuca sativa]